MLFKPQPLLFPPKVSTSLLLPADHHNYVLGGQMVNTFAAGRIGTEDDFWMVGAEPPVQGEEAGRPCITGNLLDAFGRRLVALDRNQITFAARPSEVVAAEEGWRLVCAGREVLRVQTRPARAGGCALTYLHGICKDKRGAVRLETRGGVDSPSLLLRGPHAYGLRPDDTFAVNDGLTEDELRQAAAIMRRQ